MAQYTHQFEQDWHKVTAGDAAEITALASLAAYLSVQVPNAETTVRRIRTADGKEGWSTMITAPLSQKLQEALARATELADVIPERSTVTVSFTLNNSVACLTVSAPEHESLHSIDSLIAPVSVTTIKPPQSTARRKDREPSVEPLVDDEHLW